jgi:DNA-binding transcriptional ArsR family regulator
MEQIAGRIGEGIGAAVRGRAEFRGPVGKQKVNIDRVFHALGDPTRRAIVERLSERPLSVSLLAKPLAITLAAVVQHLQILELSGLVRTEKIGRVRTCQIEADGFSVAEKWISERRAIWERRFDRLGDLLAEDVDEK